MTSDTKPRSATQQAIDNAASRFGWTRTDNDQSNTLVWTRYTRNDSQVIVYWTPTGRVSSYDFRQGRVGLRFGGGDERGKRGTVLAELAV